MIFSAEAAWKSRAIEAERKLETAIEAHEADKKAFSDAMRIVQQYVTGDRQWAHGTRTSMIRLADGRKVRFADFIIPDPEPDPLVEAVTVTIRGKGDHRVRLDELARLIRGGARIERIEQ